MSTDTKVCLTTFVYGDKYKDFIPLLIYSIKKAYPNYNVIIFVDGTLNKMVSNQLNILRSLYEFKIIENSFEDLNISTPLEAKLVRWIIPYKEFKKFDYLYIVDIDMLYIKEPLDLHEQHIKHMEFLELPFSNIYRDYFVDGKSLSALKMIYKQKLGINIGSLKKHHLKRLSGLHFVKIKPYFNIINEEQKNLEKSLKDKSYRKKNLFRDEVYLYTMLEKSGFDMSKLGRQSNPVKMLDFNSFNNAEFRPHHGIHLGLFRVAEMPKLDNRILSSTEYQYYIREFKDIINDKMFWRLLKDSSNWINNIFSRLFKYYDIPTEY